MSYEKLVKPVALPPGRARLSTSPAPTGSGTIANTIGMARVARSSGPAAELPDANITSGANPINSSANRRLASTAPPAQRVSIRTLLPSVQPSCFSFCRNAWSSVGYSESFALAGRSIPTRRSRSGCWARPAPGQIATAPPASIKKSRRFIALPPYCQGKGCCGRGPTLIKSQWGLGQQFTQSLPGRAGRNGKLLTAPRARPLVEPHGAGAAANGWNLPLTSALKARVTYSALVSVAPARSRLTLP